MKKILITAFINLIAFGLYAQVSNSTTDIATFEKITKQIDSSKNLKLLIDTVLFTDSAFIINTYFVDAKNILKKQFKPQELILEQSQNINWTL